MSIVKNNLHLNNEHHSKIISLNILFVYFDLSFSLTHYKQNYKFYLYVFDGVCLYFLRTINLAYIIRPIIISSCTRNSIFTFLISFWKMLFRHTMLILQSSLASYSYLLWHYLQQHYCLLTSSCNVKRTFFLIANCYFDRNKAYKLSSYHASVNREQIEAVQK